jgi:hypothetical protein
VFVFADQLTEMILAQKVQSDKRDVVDAAVHRARLSSAIGTRLAESALALDDTDALAVADMICAAARPENIWHAENLHDADGKTYSGYGSLNLVGSRLDPAYMKTCSTRARRRTKAALARVRPQVGEQMRFITFTVPPLFGFDFERGMSLLDGALVLLKKRQWFKSVVRGSVFGDEVTTGERGTHFHCHSHMLGWTKKIDAQDLRSEWTSCLKAAAKKMGVSHLPINTGDGLAVAKIKRVVAKVRNGESVTLEKAIQETCKYTVKGSDLSDVPSEHLCQVERVLRRRKMIVTFGECNAQKGTARKAKYLDYTSTTDGSSIIQETSETSENAATTSKVEKKESLREYGARMIREGRRDVWLKTLAYIYAERREYRKIQLAEKYPNATFRTLDGKVWCGVALDHS